MDCPTQGLADAGPATLLTAEWDTAMSWCVCTQTWGTGPGADAIFIARPADERRLVIYQYGFYCIEQARVLLRFSSCLFYTSPWDLGVSFYTWDLDDTWHGLGLATGIPMAYCAHCTACRLRKKAVVKLNKTSFKTLKYARMQSNRDLVDSAPRLSMPP